MCGNTLPEILGYKADNRIHKLSDELDVLSPAERTEVAEIMHFLADRRNLLPTMVQLGQELKQRYQAEKGCALKHEQVNMEDIRLTTQHNFSRCQTMFKRYGSRYHHAAEALRMQQQCHTAVPNDIRKLKLPESDKRLLAIMYDRLRALGIDPSSDSFKGCIPQVLFNQAFLEHLQQGEPLKPDDIGGYPVLLQLIALAESGLLKPGLLRKIIQHELWQPVFLENPDIAEPESLMKFDVPGQDGTHEEDGTYINLATTMTATADAICQSAYSFNDSRAIGQLLKKNDHTAQKAVAKWFDIKLPESAPETAIGEQLAAKQNDIATLELAVTDAQYRFSKKHKQQVERLMSADHQQDLITYKPSSINTRSYPNSREQRAFTRLIQANAPERVNQAISIACGKGSCVQSCLKAFEHQKMWSMEGYDISEHQISRARISVFPEASVKVTLGVRDCSALTEKFGEYDLVIMRAPEPAGGEAIWSTIYSNAQKLLAPDGILIMTHYYFEHDYDLFNSLPLEEGVIKVKSGRNPYFDSEVFDGFSSRVGRDYYYRVLKKE